MMKTFENVYSWSVIDEIKNGRLVYCLDREEQKVFCVNDIPVENYVAILKYCREEDTNRYLFWYENHNEITEVTMEEEE